MDDQDETRGEDVSPRRVLFISHLHKDQAIADVLREFVEASTAGRVDVFQSSSAQSEGPRIGRALNDDLTRALRDASVVTLLHTSADDDWAACMWELGVATDPSKPDTKVVLLECGENIPRVFDNQVRVNLRKLVDVQRFVDEFLTSTAFFPTFPEAVTEFRPRSDQVARFAQELYGHLEAVLPSVEGEPDQNWCTYPFMTLQLSFDQAKAIEEAQPPDRLSETINLLVNNVLVLKGDSEAGRVFGVPDAPRSVLLKTLIAIWQEKTPTPSSNWIEGLACQVMDGVLGTFPTLRWELLRGADSNDGSWYGPVVVSVRKVPRGRVIEFDVTLCKFFLDEAGAVEVGVPPVADRTHDNRLRRAL